MSSWQSSTSYDDSSITSGTTYYYFVKSSTSSSGANSSGYSSYDTGFASLPAAPTISIMSPSTPVALNVDQSRTFNIEATAGSGIKGIEWYIGSTSQKYTSYTDSWVYYKQGFIDLKIAALVCVGFFIGGLAGAKFAVGIPDNILRKIFGAILFLASIKMMLSK